MAALHLANFTKKQVLFHQPITYTFMKYLPYHFDDLKYLLENCQNKPKVIGISECSLRANKTALSMKDYTYEWTPTEALR